jgi:hypothetical protein
MLGLDLLLLDGLWLRCWSSFITNSQSPFLSDFGPLGSHDCNLGWAGVRVTVIDIVAHGVSHANANLRWSGTKQSHPPFCKRREDELSLSIAHV